MSEPLPVPNMIGVVAVALPALAIFFTLGRVGLNIFARNLMQERGDRLAAQERMYTLMDQRDAHVEAQNRARSEEHRAQIAALHALAEGQKETIRSLTEIRIALARQNGYSTGGPAAL